MDVSSPRKEVTLRIAGPHQFTAFLLFFIAPPFLYILCTPLGREKTALWVTILFVALLTVGVIFLGLEVFISRLVATEEGLIIYTLFNRKLVEVAYTDIDAYRPGKDGRWRIYVGEVVYTPPRVDLGEMHRLMRMMAPKALGAKRWKCGQVPPEEDLLNLRPFDAPFLMPYVGGLLLAIVIALLLPKLAGVLGYFGSRSIPEFYELRLLFTRLDLTKLGIRQRAFGRVQSIAWDEVIAVFCHQDSRGRHFIAVSRNTAIPIPRPIAQDLDAMRKFFYNLPDGTPCVNFDESFKKGYRRKKRKSIGAVSPAPELAGGSF